MNGDDEEAVRRAELVMHLRHENVAGRATLAALESVPRSLFLDAEHRALAYRDRAAPIECGQTISQPTIVAMMTEALQVEPSMKVLEIGTGSGYQTAILAKLGADVVSVERYYKLSHLAAGRLALLRLSNVSLHVADGHEGWPDEAPYDRILVTAAAPAVPEALVEQLTPEGILVAPIGEESAIQALMRCVLTDEGLMGEHIADVRFVPMVKGVAQIL
ncbi:MAG: protein-L-isoaspartate(D-aspartate) O-methyltransferase [Pseudomonadota bacterium]